MSKPTRVLLFVLVVLASLGAWLTITASHVDPDEPAAASEAGASLPLAGANLNVPESESLSREGVTAGKVEPEEVSEDAPAIVIEPYVTRELRGTLTLSDEFGNGPFFESGTFAFWLWEKDETSYHEVQVGKGEWETVLPEGVRISLAEVELGGRVAAFIAEDGPPINIPESGYLELEAYIPKATSLRVFAADSGVELNQVTVVVERASLPNRQHPGELGLENRVAQGISSPIQLQAVSGVRIDEPVTYSVMAPGFAWSSVVVKHSDGGSHELRLKRSGALIVRLSEEEPDPGPVFRLWQHQVPVFRQRLGWGKELVIEDLAEGVYTATVDVGQNWRNLKQLGKAQVRVEAGGQTLLDLDITPGPELERGTLKGILVIPPEWELPSFRIWLRLKGEIALRSDSLALAESVELANVEGRSDAWHFEFTDLVASRWQLGVEPTLFAKNLQVKTGEPEELTIEIPPPADWVVRTIDPHTGKPALVDELRYRAMSSYTNEWKIAEEGTKANEFRVRAPMGRVILRAEGQGFRRSQRTFFLEEREGEIALEVASHCGIDVVLRDGSKDVAWTQAVKVDVAGIQSDGHTFKREPHNGAQRIYLSKPGAYVLSIIEVPGFASPGEQTVIIEPGLFTRIVVQLASSDG